MCGGRTSARCSLDSLLLLPKPEWFGNRAKAIYAAGVHFSSMRTS
jgi:hypothetical protein